MLALGEGTRPRKRSPFLLLLLLWERHCCWKETLSSFSFPDCLEAERGKVCKSGGGGSSPFSLLIALSTLLSLSSLSLPPFSRSFRGATFFSRPGGRGKRGEGREGRSTAARGGPMGVAEEGTGRVCLKKQGREGYLRTAAATDRPTDCRRRLRRSRRPRSRLCPPSLCGWDARLGWRRRERLRYWREGGRRVLEARYRWFPSCSFLQSDPSAKWRGRGCGIGGQHAAARLVDFFLCPLPLPQHARQVFLPPFFQPRRQLPAVLCIAGGSTTVGPTSPYRRWEIARCTDHRRPPVLMENVHITVSLPGARFPPHRDSFFAAGVAAAAAAVTTATVDTFLRPFLCLHPSLLLHFSIVTHKSFARPGLRLKAPAGGDVEKERMEFLHDLLQCIADAASYVHVPSEKKGFLPFHRLFFALDISFSLRCRSIRSLFV